MFLDVTSSGASRSSQRQKLRRCVMTIKSKLAVIAASAALGMAALGVATPALAQSAYTSGTEASSVRAGYPSPDGNGLFDNTPGHAPGLRAFAMVPRDPPAVSPLTPREAGGGSLGYNRMVEHDY
jgi:hypothetical protein